MRRGAVVHVRSSVFDAIVFESVYAFLQEKFPRLVEKYGQWYTRNTYAPEEYRKRIAERFGDCGRSMDSMCGHGTR